MLRCLAALPLLLTALAAHAQGPDLPFTVEVVEGTQQNAPALHSGAVAEHDGRWLFLAGRTNGLHGITVAGDAFPPSAANAEAVVYDPATDQRWAASLDGLPAALREPLEAVNVQHHQDGETLYVVGGYGYSATAGDHVTYGTLTAVDVPGLIGAVIGGGALEPHLRLLADDRLRVTGGHLVALGDRYVLAGGQRFDGPYRFLPEPGQQAYTDALRAFTIEDDGTTLALSGYAETVDPDRLHRRDGNVGPVVRADGSAAYALYGGVFTEDTLPYRTPVTFDAESLEERAYEAQFGHYTAPLLPIYDAERGAMHTVFFGGMGQFWYDEASQTVEQDNLVPFIDDVAVLTVGEDGSVSERVLDPLPGYLGTNAYLFLDPATPTTAHGVIELQALSGRTRVGAFLGGIAADTEHPGFMPTTGTTWASDRLFELYVTPLTSSAVEGGAPEGFRVALTGPNPFRERTRLAVTLDAPGTWTVAVFDAVGRRVARLHDGPLAAGPHVFDVEGARLPAGVYGVRVSGPQGAFTERLVRLR
ncbi:MAG: hypothetical protein R3181_01855 [Rubricoccaceae bacterium]|nr:hypothetical protein [Rubricoccaceae bacterium]